MLKAIQSGGHNPKLKHNHFDSGIVIHVPKLAMTQYQNMYMYMCTLTIMNECREKYKVQYFRFNTGNMNASEYTLYPGGVAHAVT